MTKKKCSTCCAKWFYIIVLFLIISYPILFLGQLWAAILAPEIFFKITLTYGVILLTLGLVWLIGKYFCEEARLKKDKYHN